MCDFIVVINMECSRHIISIFSFLKSFYFLDILISVVLEEISPPGAEVDCE